MNYIPTVAIIILACFFSILITFYNFIPKKTGKSVKRTLKKKSLSLFSVRYFWSKRSTITKSAFLVFFTSSLIGIFLLMVNYFSVWFSIIICTSLTTILMYLVIIYFNFLEKIIDYYFYFINRTRAGDIALLTLMLPLIYIGYQLAGIIQATFLWLLILLICMYLNHFTIFKYMFFTIIDHGYIPKSKHGNFKVALLWLVNLLVTLYAEVLLINKIAPTAYIANSAIHLLLLTLTSFITNDAGNSSSIWGEIQNLLIAGSGVYFLVVFLASLLTMNNIKKNSRRRVSVRRPHVK